MTVASGRRVLVADDEHDVRMMLAMLLRRAGWQVDEAADGTAALEQINASGYDALVLDLRMPGLDGLEVATAATGAGFDAPIVLFSGYLNPDVRDAATAAGITTLEKVDADQLAATLDRLSTAR